MITLRYAASWQSQLAALLSAALLTWQSPAPAKAQGVVDPVVTEKSRLPVPSAEDQKVSATKVRDVFGAEAANANNAESKATLAKNLLGYAAGTTASADRYVLLEGAKSLAMDSGNVDLVFDALNAIAADYAVDAKAAQIAALEALVSKASAESVRKVVERLLAVAREKADEDDLNVAEEYAQLASKAARRGKDRDLQRTVLDLMASIREQKTLASRAKSLTQKVQQNPADREALTALGAHRCFVEGSWDEGLPLLAKGSDLALKELARLEAGGGATAAERVVLGDNWWNFSLQAPKEHLSGAETRAQTHYALALADLSGLEHARVSKRLAEIDRKLAAHGKKGGKQRQRKGVLISLDARVAPTISGPEGPAKNASVRVSSWRDGAGAFKALPVENTLAPIWNSTACNGEPGLIFTGVERLQINCPVPPKGTMILVCFPKATAHQRLISGPIGVALRSDGGVWFEAKTDKTTERVMSAKQGLYRPLAALAIAGSWPSPFSLAIGSNLPDVGPALPGLLAGGSPWILGGSVTGAEPFSGMIQQVIVFNRPLTNAELASALPGLF
ncbi:MAG: hypothetical protein WCJ18_00825 [Planctomycetota bacterium]